MALAKCSVHRMRMASAALMASAWCLGASAADPPTELENCRVPRCLVSLIHEVDVPAIEAGQVLEVEAREGMLVESGSLLMQMDDELVRRRQEVAALESEAAMAKADSDVNIRYSKAASEVAHVDYDSIVTLNKRSAGTISASEERRKLFEWKSRELQIEQAELEQQVTQITGRVKQAEMAAADVSLRRHRITSPLAGMVVAVNKHAGEWAAPGESLVRIVRIDRLRLEGFVKQSEFDPAEIDNCLVQVEARMARGRIEQFEGKITFVHPQLEADGEYRVWAEVVNRSAGKHWLLRPGMHVDMTVLVSSRDVAGE